MVPVLRRTQSFRELPLQLLQAGRKSGTQGPALTSGIWGRTLIHRCKKECPVLVNTNIVPLSKKRTGILMVFKNKIFNILKSCYFHSRAERTPF